MKSSDKVLNYLIFGQTLSEANMEILENHKFHPWRHGERMEVMPGIVTDPHNVYHFGYPLF